MPHSPSAFDRVLATDVPALLARLADLLQDAGYQPITAHGPDSGLRFVGPGPFADAWQVRARLDRQLAAFPFVFTTMADDSGTRASAAGHALRLVLRPDRGNPLPGGYPRYRVEEQRPDRAAFIVAFADDLIDAEGAVQRRAAQLARAGIVGDLQIVDQDTEQIIDVPA